MKIDTLDGMRQASTCMNTAKWMVETTGNTSTGGDTGRQKTQYVVDRQRKGRDRQRIGLRCKQGIGQQRGVGRSRVPEYDDV